MDMRMPELDGYQATQQLKANGALKHIPVIAVTPGSVTLEVNGTERTLPLSDTINVVQLSASAPGFVLREK